MNKIYTSNWGSYVLFLLLVFVSAQAVAQHDDGPVKPSTTPNIVPPPPNSASLGLYGQVPLNQFTGNGAIKIPLHSIKAGNIEVPVSLSYSSDGIKVDQYESNVGMGWVLNAGGVITRQINDYQDTYRGRYQRPNVPSNSAQMLEWLNNASAAPEVDTQPDIYSYNFGGLSGKFFLDDNNLPVEIEPSGLKIEITSNFLEEGTGVAGPDRQPEVIITDTKGIKYFFGGGSSLETSLIRDLAVQGQRPNAIKTSWYLTKIVDQATNNTITFNYDSNSVVYLSGLEQKLDYNETQIHPQIFLTTAKYTSFSDEAILKEIVSNDSRVTFSYSKRFTDNDFSFLKMDEINIYNNQNVLINKIGLNYVQYSGDSFPNTAYLPDPIKESPDYLKKRFYLSEIKEHSNLSNSKVHQFEYYSPENLPARFSFAKDDYGLFNGKDNTTLISDQVPVPYAIAHPISSPYTELANRNPDSNFGYFGLLKKIIYPTKGTSTLVYEPHLNGKVTVPIYPVKKSVALSVITAFNERSSSAVSTIFSSDIQKIKLYARAQFNTRCEEPDPHDPQATISIRDIATGLNINFINREGNVSEVTVGPFYTFNPDSDDSITFTLEANKSYEVKLDVTTPCVNSNIKLDYYADPVTYEDRDVQVGGFRVLKTINNDLSNKHVETQKYFYYGGTYISRAPIAYIRKIYRNNHCEPNPNAINYTVSSSGLARMYSLQNAQFGYTVVVKSYGENFENGGEEFRYDTSQDGLPYIVQGEDDKTTPFTNGFGAGNLLNHKIFKIGPLDKHIILQETTNQYKHDESKDKSVTGLVVYLTNEDYSYTVILPGGTGNPEPICLEKYTTNSFSVSQYSVRSQWNYLDKTIEKNFDINGENPIVKETTYQYNNPLHCQPTSVTSKSSKGETLETRYDYPHELSGTVQGAVMQQLINQNRIGTPVKTQTFVNSRKVSESVTKYEQSSVTSNLLLPKSVYANKLNTAIDINVNADRKITFDKYDDMGNILQYTPEGGLPVAIIWGYDKTKPIAKVENATYDEAIGAYNTDGSTFRNSLPGAMITTYSYKPLVGITTVTDPKGFVTTYDYDDFNRLQVVKDNKGNIVSENKYHYKN